MVADARKEALQMDAAVGFKRMTVLLTRALSPG
jgi:hypothetical protein